MYWGFRGRIILCTPAMHFFYLPAVGSPLLPPPPHRRIRICRSSSSCMRLFFSFLCPACAHQGFFFFFLRAHQKKFKELCFPPTRKSVPTAVRWMGVGIVLHRAAISRGTCVPTLGSVPTAVRWMGVGIVLQRAAHSRATCLPTRKPRCLLKARTKTDHRGPSGWCHHNLEYIMR